jgi:hypothetical protein
MKIKYLRTAARNAAVVDCHAVPMHANRNPINNSVAIIVFYEN